MDEVSLEPTADQASVEDKAEDETAKPPEDSKAQELKAQDLKLQAQQLKLKAHEEYRVAQEAPIRVMQ